MPKPVKKAKKEPEGEMHRKLKKATAELAKALQVSTTSLE